MTHTISNIIDLTNAPTPPRWFEFLLEPGRLQQHLGTSGCDPSPTQLITLFFRNTPIIESNSVKSPNQRNGTSPQALSPATNTTTSATTTTTTTNGNANSNTTNSTCEDPKAPVVELADQLLIDYADSAEVLIPPDSYEAKYRTKKAYALQALAIKVASFLKWDLDAICNNLSIPTQYKLMQALHNACSSKNCPLEVQKFASVCYCHWFLKSAITYQLSTLQPQTSNTTIIYLSQLQQQQQQADSLALSSMGELFAPNSPQLKLCSNELHNYIWELAHNKDNATKRVKSSVSPFKKAKLSRPTLDCFDSRDEKFNDWTKCEPIEPIEFIEAACYDLGRFLFFEESYSTARESFEMIKASAHKFPKLSDYLKSSTDFSTSVVKSEQNGTSDSTASEVNKDCDLDGDINDRRRTEEYLFDCMAQFSRSQKKDAEMDVEEGDISDNDGDLGEDSDLRFEQSNHQRLPDNSAWYLQVPALAQQQIQLETSKGDLFMSQGNFKQAMGCFVGSLMLMTDYFRSFSKNYVDEELCISRMIQCSISLCCFTQAVALCQMSKNLNYTIAFKQLNERVCNDCCDDIYECIWNVTLLEYIINLHSKRGEVERRTKVIQLIGQLELNENNPEEILREAEHVRRGRFFRIMSNKYL